MIAIDIKTIKLAENFCESFESEKGLLLNEKATRKAFLTLFIFRMLRRFLYTR